MRFATGGSPPRQERLFTSVPGEIGGVEVSPLHSPEMPLKLSYSLELT